MAYADRKAKFSKLEFAKLNSKWANAPRGETPAKVSEQHRRLWQALNNFVTERGGAVVSPMFAFPIRLEVAPDSELPDKLRELGHDLIYREQDTRIGARISKPGRWGRRDLNAGYSFRAVDVFELKLPK
jgi:hypothetical protein